MGGDQDPECSWHFLPGPRSLPVDWLPGVLKGLQLCLPQSHTSMDMSQEPSSI